MSCSYLMIRSGRIRLNFPFRFEYVCCKILCDNWKCECPELALNIEDRSLVNTELTMWPYYDNCLPKSVYLRCVYCLVLYTFHLCTRRQEQFVACTIFSHSQKRSDWIKWLMGNGLISMTYWISTLMKVCTFGWLISLNIVLFWKLIL